MCKTWLQNGDFSGSQLNKTRGQPACKGCTGGQRNGMFCKSCKKHKPLDGFSKAQRRNNTDEKLCMVCQDKKNRLEADDFYDGELMEDSDAASSGSSDDVRAIRMRKHVFERANEHGFAGGRVAVGPLEKLGIEPFFSGRGGGVVDARAVG